MPPLALRSLIEKLRSLGYPTVPSYHLGPEDIEGLDLEEEEEEEEAAEGQRAEEGGGGSTRVPEGLAVLQKRLVDWCTAMVRLGGHFRVFSCPFEAQCSARIGTFRGTFR